MKLIRNALTIGAGLGCAVLAVAGSAVAASPSHSSARSGGNLTVLDIGGNFRSLSSLQKSGLGNYLKYSAIYQNLFTLDAKGRLIPQLALKYAYSNNNKTITFYLRHGVHFQDGTLMNAGAVAFDLSELANPAVNSACLPYLTSFVSAVPEGTYKVAVNFSQPDGSFVRIISGSICGAIVSPAAVKSEGLDGFGNHPVATGPYQFSSQVAGTTSVWTKWGGYWNKKDRGHFNTITVTAVNDDQSCIAAVESGTAQICANGDTTDYLSVRHNPRVKTIVSPGTSVESITLNFRQAPFNNILARRAVASAIDTKVISKSLYHGTVPGTETLIAPSSYAFEGYTVPGYPKYDLATARSLVAQLPGHQLSFSLVCQSIPGEVSIAEAIQAQLAQAGIQMTIVPEDIVSILTQSRSGQYQASLLGSTSYPDPDVLYYRSFNAASNDNHAGINDPLINQLSEKARETVSTPQKRALYNQETLRVSKLLPEIPLFPQPIYWFISPKLRNFNPVGNEVIQWQDLYMS